MSLVLNTNASSGSYEVANMVLGNPGYPDFNQILIHPSFPASYSDGYRSFTPTDNDTFPTTGNYVVKLVNGTPINFWSDDIVAPICRIGSGITTDNGGFGSNSTFYAKVFSYRIGVNKQLPAGLEIGKNIYGQFTLSVNSSYVKPQCDVTIGLLHTDGTLSKFPVINIINWTTSSNPGNNTQVLQYSQMNANGLISQAGDYVIMEINNKVSDNYNLGFGRSGGPQTSNTSRDFHGIRALPCQVSVD